MFFCPVCNNIFNITRASGQLGGAKKDIDTSSDEHLSGTDYEKIIEQILSGHDVDDIENLSFDDFIKSPSYKKLKSKQKELVYNKIQDLLPNENKKIIKEGDVKPQTEFAYFKCNNCGFLKKIDDGTLIFSRVSSDISQSYVTSDISTMVHSDILPRTRKYICPNDKCVSHKDSMKREAVFFRMNNTPRVKYICTACNTNFGSS